MHPRNLGIDFPLDRLTLIERGFRPSAEILLLPLPMIAIHWAVMSLSCGFSFTRRMQDLSLPPLLHQRFDLFYHLLHAEDKCAFLFFGFHNCVEF